MKNSLIKIGRTYSLIGSSITLLVLGSLIVGCNTEKTKIVKEKADPVVIETGASATDSDLVESAEQLLSPATFMYSYKLASLALAKNPKNLKAQFYVKLLSPLEVYRGYYKIIEPVLNSDELAKQNSYLKTSPDSALKDFLTENVDESKKLKTKEDGLNIVREYFIRLNEFRKFLKANEDSEFKIRMNPYVFKKEVSDKMMNSCKIQQHGDQYIYECDYQQVATTYLDKADMLMLRQAVSGWVLYGALLTSYNIDGLENALKLDPQNLLSQRAKISLLFQNKNFGTLADGRLFAEMKNIGSDAASAMEWAIKFHDEECNKDRSNNLTQGFCEKNANSQDDQYNLNMLQQSLKGAIIVDLKLANDESDRKETTALNVFAWSNNPIKDLRSVLPNKYNDCGKGVSLLDETLGGVFVDNNASKFVLNSTCE